MLELSAILVASAGSKTDLPYGKRVTCCDHPRLKRRVHCGALIHAINDPYTEMADKLIINSAHTPGRTYLALSRDGS